MKFINVLHTVATYRTIGILSDSHIVRYFAVKVSLGGSLGHVQQKGTRKTGNIGKKHTKCHPTLMN